MAATMPSQAFQDKPADFLAELMVGWKTLFPGYSVARVSEDAIAVGIGEEGVVLVQDLRVNAGLPRLMVLSKVMLNPANKKHEAHWYRVTQILNTDIRGVTFIYHNRDPETEQPVLTMRSSLAVGGSLSQLSIDTMALYCEVVAIFEARRIMNEVLAVSLTNGVLRTDMYDKTEGTARSQFHVIHPGADSLRPVDGKALWKGTLSSAKRWKGLALSRKGLQMEATLTSGRTGLIGYHEKSHTLTLDHVLPQDLAMELFGRRNSFEVSELLNVLHTLHPMGCFEYDPASE